jgi:hypothetical protein
MVIKKEKNRLKQMFSIKEEHIYNIVRIYVRGTKIPKA